MVENQGIIPNKDRFEILDHSSVMKAVVTKGNGGYDQLDYRPYRTLSGGCDSAQRQQFYQHVGLIRF